MQGRLSFKDLVLIAGAMLDAPAEEVERMMCRSCAEAALAAPFAGSGEIDLYPDPIEQAAICCSEIIRNRPLPAGNSRLGYECLREMLVRGGYPWPSEDADEIVEAIEGLEAGAISETDFVRWVRARVGLGEWLRYRRRGPTA